MFYICRVDSPDLAIDVDHNPSRFLPEILRFIIVEAVWAESVQLWSKYWPPRDLFLRYDKEKRPRDKWPIHGVSGSTSRSPSRSMSPKYKTDTAFGGLGQPADGTLLSQSVGKNAPIFTAIQSLLENKFNIVQKLQLINLNISVNSWKKLA